METIRKTSRIPLAIGFLLALLLHGLLYFVPLSPDNKDNRSNTAARKNERVEVVQVTPKELEMIKNNLPKKLLLSKERSSLETEPKKDREIPRYASDRDIFVEHEMQARVQSNIPQNPSVQVAPPQSENSKAEKKSGNTHSDKSILVKKLGVPLNLGQAAKPTPLSAFPMAMSVADQLVLETTLPMGGQNLLNAEKSKYYSFFARLHEAIVPIWESRARAAVPKKRLIEDHQYVTVVEIILNENGALKRLSFLQASGVPEFDAAVERTFDQVTEIPNPPKELVTAENEVHVPFSFAVWTQPSSFRFPQVLAAPPLHNPNWN